MRASHAELNAHLRTQSWVRAVLYCTVLYCTVLYEYDTVHLTEYFACAAGWLVSLPA
jgi:hypothetical protein